MSGITIKSAADVVKMEAAGRIVEDTLNLLSETAEIGMTTAELDEIGERSSKAAGPR
jgi:methionyl aminopeptidase